METMENSTAMAPAASSKKARKTSRLLKAARRFFGTDPDRTTSGPTEKKGQERRKKAMDAFISYWTAPFYNPGPHPTLLPTITWLSGR